MTIFLIIGSFCSILYVGGFAMKNVFKEKLDEKAALKSVFLSSNG